MRDFGRARVALLLAGLLAIVATARAEPQQFTATAHDLKTGRVLYTEQYDVQVDNGRWVSGTTRYVLASGQQVAERRFDFTQDRYVPVFTLEQSDPAYREGITRVGKDKVDLFMVRDGDRQTASLDRVRDLVADCGAQAYVIDHLDALQSGGTLHFTLAVAGRVSSYAMHASKVGDVDANGVKAIRVRVELDSVLRLVLPSLELVLDPQSRRLLEYSGIANLKDPATKKAFSARIVFTYK